MTKADRQKIFDKFGGKCAYCGCNLTGKWHIDHAEPLQRHSTYDRTGKCQYPERDHIDNCLPSCISCNLYKSSCDIETFRWKIGNTIIALNRDRTQYRFALKYGLLIETKNPVKFYFEIVEEKKAIEQREFNESTPF